MSLKTKVFIKNFGESLEDSVNDWLYFVENNLQAEVLKVAYPTKEHAYIIYKT